MFFFSVTRDSLRGRNLAMGTGAQSYVVTESPDAQVVGTLRPGFRKRRYLVPMIASRFYTIVKNISDSPIGLFIWQSGGIYCEVGIGLDGLLI